MPTGVDRRGAQPPMPPGSYDRDIPDYIPREPDRFWYRGNFCGRRVPGIPLLPGMAGYTVPRWRDNAIGGPNPPWMSVDVARLWLRDPNESDAWLADYVACGLTHMQCTVGHAVEIGMSIDQYVAYCARVQEFGLWADQWFLGFGLMARDRDVEYWKPILDPWIDALLSNKVIDTGCVGWQLDQFNTGDERMIAGRMQSPIQSIIDYVADRVGPSDIPLGTHWVNEAGAWNSVPTWNDELKKFELRLDRIKWWKDQRNKLLWFHHQGDSNVLPKDDGTRLDHPYAFAMDIGEYQAKLVDSLKLFGPGDAHYYVGTSGLFGDRPFAVVIYESTAQPQFNLKITEEEGDLRSSLLVRTKGLSHIGGYGGGASRRPDGTVL